MTKAGRQDVKNLNFDATGNLVRSCFDNMSCMYKTSTQLQDVLSINNGLEPITDWSYPSKIAKKLGISIIKTVDANVI